MCAFWADKHRPKDLQKLSFHKTLNSRLKCLIEEDDFPHLLVYGPPGSGKKTRIMCLLKEMFGQGVERLRREELSFTTPSNKKLQISVMSSNYHMEVNPSLLGIYDKSVIIEVIKNLAQIQQLDISSEKPFKLIVLANADNLTRDAQNALRRTMEKYAGNCRLILRANSISKISPAIKSRCMLVRIPSPTTDEIVDILQVTLKKESLQISKEFAEKIAVASDRNLRKALLMVETCKVQKYPFADDQKIPQPDWFGFIDKISRSLLVQQNIHVLEEVGNNLRKLIEHGIPPTIIMRIMLLDLLDNCDAQLRQRIAELASFYCHQMQHSNKELFHLEAFVAQVMLAYSDFMNNMLGEFMLE